MARQLQNLNLFLLITKARPFRYKNFRFRLENRRNKKSQSVTKYVKKIHYKMFMN